MLKTLAILTLASATVGASTPAGSTSAASIRPLPDQPAATPWDFDGNSYQDLAVGVVGEGWARGLDRVEKGLVNVLYSTTTGVASSGSQAWSSVLPGPAPGDPEHDGLIDNSEHFGAASASADFDGDGFADLAVGAPDEAVGDVKRAGAVRVLYGSRSGLTERRGTAWSQATPGIAGTTEPLDLFGRTVAAADFDADGYGDLAIGVPRETIGSGDDQYSAGGLHVLYGSAPGLQASRAAWFSQNTAGVRGIPEGADYFGGALANGDVNGDGYADLAVSAPGESIGDVSSAGAVTLLLGGPGGLSATGSRAWSQDSPGVRGTAEEICPHECEEIFGDSFGSQLVFGDFDADGFDDLAVGVPLEVIPGLPNESEFSFEWWHGAVQVLYGSASGLTHEGDEFFPAVDEPSGAALGSSLGVALAAGDLNGDSIDDLAVGAPGQADPGYPWQPPAPGEEYPRAPARTGAVWVVPGSSSGLGTLGAPTYSPGGRGFGASVSILDLGRSDPDDLVVAIPAWRSARVTSAGAVAIYYGKPTGPQARNPQLWHQASPGVPDRPEESDRFGALGNLACATNDYCFISHH